MDVYFDPERPRTYSYKGVNRSLVDQYVYKYWWPIALKAIPARAPANLVSLVGNLGSYLAFLIVSGLLFGPAAEFGRERAWLFGLAAAGLFFYQTLDALDGIQARRTGASGPLGEFVDHWFDSFNVFLVPLGIAAAFPVIPWQLLVPILLVFTATNWILIKALTNTNILVFDRLSSEEAQLFVQLFYLSVWILGYDFWATPIVFGLAPIVAAALLFPLGMMATAIRGYRDSGGGKELAVALASLLPVGAWLYFAHPRLGSPSLVLGGLLLGCSGARYVGQVMQERLIGRTYVPLLADIPAGGAAIAAAAALPAVPDRAVAISAALFLLWTFAALAAQFRVTLCRIRGMLGRGLFWPLTGETKTDD